MLRVDTGRGSPRSPRHMDANRFAALSRTLSEATTRRRTAVGLLLGGALGLADVVNGAAKNKGKGKGKGKDKKKDKKDPQATACEAVDKACGQGGCAFGAACCFNYNCNTCPNAFCVGTPPGQ